MSPWFTSFHFHCCSTYPNHFNQPFLITKLTGSDDISAFFFLSFKVNHTSIWSCSSNMLHSRFHVLHLLARSRCHTSNDSSHCHTWCIVYSTLCLSILTQILSWLGTDKYSQNTFHTFLVIAVTAKSHRPSALNMPAKYKNISIFSTSTSLPLSSLSSYHICTSLKVIENDRSCMTSYQSTAMSMWHTNGQTDGHSPTYTSLSTIAQHDKEMCSVTCR